MFNVFAQIHLSPLGRGKHHAVAQGEGVSFNLKFARILLLQSILNSLQHAIQIIKNIIIPKSNDAISLFFQQGITNFIRSIFAMLPAIQLNDQLCLAAGKIAYGISDRKLSHKFGLAQLSIPQLCPKALFSLGTILAQFSCNRGESVSIHSLQYKRLFTLTQPSPSRERALCKKGSI